jgi:predicted nucleotide-binding protein (sugar kinase/HSP70/actin superfamily)
MKVGIPKGLLYFRYYPFILNFMEGLRIETVLSPDTNKAILDLGVKYCVDDACVPIKIFHGHAAWLRDKCDVMLIPRIMQIRDREFICPKFCGLPEMIKYSIPDMPPVTETPIYLNSEVQLYSCIKKIGKVFGKNNTDIKKAFTSALNEQKKHKGGIRDMRCGVNIALIGHPYNLYDSFINMNLVKKINALGLGIVTEECVEDCYIDDEVRNLYKRPFWSFARNSYGSSTYLAQSRKVAGIIYISSFACGIDSVVIELIKNKIGEFPFLVLKIDEQTGEAGLDTRIEAFTDMLTRKNSLERRNDIENYVPAFR